MSKRKRKNSEDSIFQQIMGCANTLIRILAGILMIVFVSAIFLLFYAKSQDPEFEIAVWVALSALFAYLCAYVAFNQSQKELSTTTVIPEFTGFVRFIVRTIARLGMFFFAGSVFLLIPLVFRHPETTLIIFLILMIVMTIICGVIYYALRPKKRSDDVRDEFDEEE